MHAHIQRPIEPGYKVTPSMKRYLQRYPAGKRATWPTSAYSVTRCEFIPDSLSLFKNTNILKRLLQAQCLFQDNATNLLIACEPQQQCRFDAYVSLQRQTVPQTIGSIYSLAENILIVLTRGLPALLIP
jgi:hypothetical protein